MTAVNDRPKSFVRESPYSPLPVEMREQLIRLGKGLREVTEIPEWQAPRRQRGWYHLVKTNGMLTPDGLNRLMAIIIEHHRPVGQLRL